MQSDEINELVNSIGALAEVLKVARDAFIETGFTRAEAITLCNGIMQSILGGKKNESDRPNR